ncbi:MAG: hypothetical protein PHI19_00065 [Clostridia bacterium]|nr:hypothetical protein [Clostridia bacterium]
MRKNVKAPEGILMMRLQKLAEASGTTLTFAHKRFYAAALDIALKGKSDEAILHMSVNDVAKAVRMPSRTVTQALRRLEDCGAIIRTMPTQTFPRKAMHTLFVKEIYEE